ncbi:MAG: ATP-dependent zinc metalloprotease FtsH [bacterium]
MKFNYKSILIWLGLITIVFVLVNISQLTGDSEVRELGNTEFRNLVKEGKIQSLSIKGLDYEGKLQSGEDFRLAGPAGERTLEFLAEHDVPTKYKKPDDNTFLQTLLASWLPMIILIIFFVFFMRQLRGGGNKAFSFGKSQHRKISKDENQITFEDVAGVDEAKEDLQEIVEFLKSPDKFTRMGAKIPRGVLLVGAPGTGKTLLAKAVAGEADAPFFSISGSDFVEMFVGVGASRVRNLFEQAKSEAPCIIFMDEIDAVGRQRGAGLGGGHDEREQTLNQLLVELDGFGSDSGVIVMSATNRPDVLDPALLRPGRFDRNINVPMPDINGRKKILEIHARNKKVEKGIDFESIAKGTPGFSGASLENLLNESALVAARKDKDAIGEVDMEEAKDKLLMGKERRSMVLSDDEKRETAFHEAGHTVAGYYAGGEDVFHKVSIIPRGKALGVTQYLPERDKYNHHRGELLSKIRMLMGGRCAEELFLEKITTGAENDIQRATELARNMVTHWGMSERLGPIHYGENQERVFLGRELGKRTQVSEYTSRIIDEEVKKIVEEAYVETKEILVEHATLLKAIVDELMERETLDKSDIVAIFEEFEDENIVDKLKVDNMENSEEDSSSENNADTDEDK